MRVEVASWQAVKAVFSASRIIYPNNSVATTFFKCFSTTSITRLKEISVKTEGNQTVVEGILRESPRSGKVLEVTGDKAHFCPACPHQLGMDIKYTDVLILAQFLRPDGCLLPKYVTGLCGKAQNRIRKLVCKAQRAGLMSEYRPDLKDGRQRESQKSRYKWRKYNIYYEDDDWE